MVFLVHPGGPLWKNKDLESWSIPKGEFVYPEEPLYAALREFEEETGQQIIVKDFIELKAVRLKSGKIVYAWACQQDVNADAIGSTESCANKSIGLIKPKREDRLRGPPEGDLSLYRILRCDVKRHVCV